MAKIAKITTILAFFLIFSFSGCKNWFGGGDEYCNPTTNQVMQTGFNEEVYVWEWLNFSTNSAQSVK